MRNFANFHDSVSASPTHPVTTSAIPNMVSDKLDSVIVMVNVISAPMISNKPKRTNAENMVSSSDLDM